MSYIKAPALNEASEWRLALARQISPAYSQNPKVRAVALTGAAARGWADRYSAVEMHAFWAELPSEAERQAAVQGAGGDWLTWGLPEAGKWIDYFYVGGVKIELSHVLVTVMEAYLADVVDRGDSSLPKQVLISAVHDALPLSGSTLIKQWQVKTATYPDELVEATIRDHLDFGEIWADREMLVERDDLLLLYQVYCQIEQHLLGILLGLNQLYLPHLQGKWLDRLVAEMPIAPPAFTLRLKQVFRMAPRTGVRLLHELIEETLALVELHQPQIDLTWARQAIRRRREGWDQAPGYR